MERRGFFGALAITMLSLPKMWKQLATEKRNSSYTCTYSRQALQRLQRSLEESSIIKANLLKIRQQNPKLAQHVSLAAPGYAYPQREAAPVIQWLAHPRAR